MNINDFKIYAFNFSSLALSMTKIDVVLKLTLLIVSIGYTVHKWYLMSKKYDK